MVDEEEGYRKIRRIPLGVLPSKGLSQSREVISGTKASCKTRDKYACILILVPW
jgi:hypothetical protein